MAPTSRATSTSGAQTGAPVAQRPRRRSTGGRNSRRRAPVPAQRLSRHQHAATGAPPEPAGRVALHPHRLQAVAQEIVDARGRVPRQRRGRPGGGRSGAPGSVHHGHLHGAARDRDGRCLPRVDAPVRRSAPAHHRAPRRLQAHQANRQAGAASGDFRVGRDTTLLTLSTLNWSYQWFDPRGRLSLDELTEQFTTYVFGALGAKNGVHHG